MEASARRRFQRIEAILASVARQQAAAEVRAKKEEARLRRVDGQSRVQVRRIQTEVRTRLEAEFRERDKRLDDELRRHKEDLRVEFREQDERLQTQNREQDKHLQAQFSERDERLQTQNREQDKHLQAQIREQDERLQTQIREQDERHEAYVRRVEARMDKRMDGISKLITTGMKLIVRIETRQEKNEVRLAEVTEKLDGLISVVDGLIRRPGSPPA